MNVKRLQIRRDTEANWASVNPVLLEGEVGFIIRNGYISSLKIGDGGTAWSQLTEYVLPKGDDLVGFLKSSDAAKVYLPRAEAVDKSQMESLLAGKLGYDEFELGRDDLIEQLQRVTLALYDDNLMALVPNDAVIMEQLAPDVREAIAAGGGSSEIVLTANRIVITDSSGKLAASDVAPTYLDRLAYLKSVTSDLNSQIVWLENAIGSNSKRINAIEETDTVELEFDGIVTNTAYDDFSTAAASMQSGGKLVFLNGSYAASGFTGFAYRATGSSYGTSYYTYYRYFSLADGRGYGQYAYGENALMVYRNTADGKLYTWNSSGNGLVEYESYITEAKIAQGSVSEYKLTDGVAKKLNSGGMIVIDHILTDDEAGLITFRSDAVPDSYLSDLRICYYKGTRNQYGVFVAIWGSDFSDMQYGMSVKAFIVFPNDDIYNVAGNASSTHSAREDQLFVIKGSSGGVYRYIKDSKSLTKLF